MDDADIAVLLHQIELARYEMAALTDAIRHLSHKVETSTVATVRLTEVIVERNEHKSWWKL